MYSMKTDYCRSCMNENLADGRGFQEFYTTSTDEQVSFWRMFQEITTINPDDDHFSQKLCKPCTDKLRVSFEFRLQTLLTQKVLLNLHQPDEDLQMLPKVKLEKLEMASDAVTVREDPPEPLIDFEPENDTVFDSYNDEESLEANHGLSVTSNNQENLGIDESIAQDNGLQDQLNKPLIESNSETITAPILTNNNEEPNIFICKKCEQGFFKKHALDKHIRQVHKADKAKTHQKYQCDICNQSFNYKVCIKNHIELRHLSDLELKYKCKICDMKFKACRALKAHEDKHTRKYDKFCEKCGAVFNLRSCLLVHMKAVHYEGPPVTCSICSKVFNGPEKLKLHMKHHTTRNFKCEMCESAYTCRRYLENHIRTVHLKDTRRDFRCDFEGCSKAYKDTEGLQRHKKYTHNKRPDFVPYYQRKKLEKMRISAK